MTHLFKEGLRGMSMAEITIATGILIFAAVPFLTTMTRSAAVTEGTLETLAQLTAAESVTEYLLASPWHEVPEGRFEILLNNHQERPGAAVERESSGFGVNPGRFIDSPAPVRVIVTIKRSGDSLKKVSVESSLLQEALKGSGRRPIVLETYMGRRDPPASGGHQ